MERAQGTVEYIGLLVALALLLGLVALAASSHAPQLPWSRLIHAPRQRRTPDQRALRNPLLRPLIDSVAPSIVIERDEYGADRTIPSSDACRHPSCAALGSAQCVLYVHVVREPGRLVLEYWTYYPDSRTDHLPIPALQGYHHDDWEGLEVAFDADGALIGARGSAHLGWNGSAPWWDEQRDDWAPYAGVVYRASGSHAVGLRRGDIDLAGDSWNGDLGVIPSSACHLRPADRAGRDARAFDPGAVAPWTKAAWTDPGVEHTGPPGSSPGYPATAARLWALAVRAARIAAAVATP